MAKHRNDRFSANASMGSSETTDQESARPTEDRVRQRAYERYQERGGEHGHDMDDWFEAEREMEGEGAPRNSPKAPRNRDQELPRRQGDSIESTIGSDRGQDRERNSPLPEGETYERDSVNQRPRS